MRACVCECVRTTRTSNFSGCGRLAESRPPKSSFTTSPTQSSRIRPGLFVLLIRYKTVVVFCTALCTRITRYPAPASRAFCFTCSSVAPPSLLLTLPQSALPYRRPQKPVGACFNLFSHILSCIRLCTLCVPAVCGLSDCWCWFAPDDGRPKRL